MSSTQDSQSTAPRGCRSCHNRHIHNFGCPFNVGFRDGKQSPVLDSERVAAEPVGQGDAFKGKPARFDDPPEDCYLVAHNTGDGWALAVENPSHEVIAYLMWPSSFGESQTPDQLQAKGFIIV